MTPNPKGLGDMLYDAIVKPIVDTFNKFTGFIRDGLIGGITGFINASWGKSKGILRKRLIAFGVPKTVTDDIIKDADGKQILEYLVQSAGTVGSILSILQAYGEPNVEIARRWAWEHKKIAYPPINEIISAVYRGNLEKTFYNQIAGTLGLSNAYAKMLFKNFEYIPSIPDLVRFATREAYLEPYVKKYGTDDEFPPELINIGKRIGLMPDDAHYYWRAHWELPSLGMGFEMLHRGVIDMPELKDLFVAHDIIPYWRDKITEISYTPYTRVDIRRMYDMGILSLDEVTRAYKDAGYNDERAEKMTDFTVMYVMGKERDLTRSQIMKLYEVGEITREETISYLISMGYDESESDYIVALKENDIREDELKDIIDIYIDNYAKGAISLDALIQELGELNLPAVRTEKIKIKALNKRRSKIKLPTKKEVFVWFSLGIITKEEMTGYLGVMGYRRIDIGRYIQQLEMAE